MKLHAAVFRRWGVAILFTVGLFWPIGSPALETGSVETAAPADTDTQAGTPAGPAGNTPGPSAPMAVTIEEAILLCLENNRALVVERLTPGIRQTFEDQERAVFDPVVSGEASGGRRKARRPSNSGSGFESFTSDAFDGAIDLEQFFPSGTTVLLEGGTTKTDASFNRDRFYTTRLGATFTQALLKGLGSEVNLVRLRQARLDSRFSQYELRGFTEALVAQVERTYWDYALVRRQIEIFEESLKVARQQLNEAEELIAVGRLAEAELAAVQAEVAAQEQGLINARSSQETERLRLLRLLNPPGVGLWQREIMLIHQPTLPEITLDSVDAHVAVAMRMLPLLNQARLLVLRDDLELVRTKNGLLPVMDLFVTLGKSGYADSFGSSIDDVSGDSYDVLLGVRLAYPLRNRDAKARHQRAKLSREQAGSALDNLSQLAELDVRIAYIEVNRAKQQIAASKSTRRFDEEKLRIETEKFRVGRSTSFLVAQAQRDLLVSRINEVQAVANYLKALVELYRLDGSLLERRGIAAPGREPVSGNG